ncbi:restriction endonuclease subunit S [Streptomyces sp. NPDC005406]|uniref:restriction endonuclease subunit S n=1 Tax=Streptomyces sp. NPDC005406 TaxID=3155339 RepID=UPI0034539914
MTPPRAKRLTRIGWLQGLSIPSDWTESKVKYVAPGMQAGEAITAESIDPTGTYPVYGGNGLRGYTEQKTHHGTCILIGRQGALCGNVHLVSGEYWASEHAIVARPADAVDPRWLAHLLEVMNLGQYSQTAAQPGIGTAQINALSVPVPPAQEQSDIADYLDRETSRIDTVIEEQQRLIDMLDERRDGVIAEAVTKGVRPGATLVESGVEWLGNIPEGWSVKPLRRCGTLMTGSTPPTDNRGNFAEEANDRPWVRPQDLSSETRASAWLTADGWSTMRPVPAGSVLVGCIAYSLGSVGYLSTAATTNQQITSVVPAEEGRYLYYAMRAAKSELWAASQMNRVPILNNQRLGSIRVPVPPVEEQRLIAAYLDEQTENIDRMRAEAQRFVELARERRSALITAAVTGQFDVREAA